MALDNEEKPTLKIRCPSCSQRFNVDLDLNNRTVECGSCEHRFRITDEVIVRSKRFYPGERPQPFGKKVARVPMSSSSSLDMKVRPQHPVQTPPLNPAHYGKEPDPAVIFPVSPQRILAGFVGVGGMLITALLLISGSGVGGILNGVPTSSRLIIAAISVLIGIFFLVYANPRARKKGLLVGCLLGAGVMAIPFYFKAGTNQFDHRKETVTAEPLIPEIDPEVAELEKLKEEVGIDPLVREQSRLVSEGSGKHAYGIWLRNLTELNKLQVRDYLVRVCNASTSSHPYPRDRQTYLLVLTGLDQSIEEIAELAQAIGTVKGIHGELGVIEVEFNQRVFSEGSLEKLMEPSDPAFYDLNKRELDSLEVKRVERAVERLAGVEPKIYRADIAKKMLELLENPQISFKGIICRALQVWLDDPAQTAKVANETLKSMVEQGQPIPKDLVSLLAQLDSTESLSMIADLWFKDPMEWELIFGEFGSPIEDEILKRLPETSGVSRTSAIRLLAKNGTAKSLPYLEQLKGSANTEEAIGIKNAEQAIESR